MKAFSFLLVLFSGCFAQQGKSIIFPKETSTDHVILKPDVGKPLKQLTVCVRSYTDLRREYSLFSIATPGLRNDNAFLIFSVPPNTCEVHINREQINFRVDPEVLDWRHTCVSWDSETGLLQLWVNGKRYPRRVTTTRSPIGPEMSVILGQEQDSFGGGFKAEQSFVGEIRDVSMWDYVVSHEIMKTLSYYSVPGNIFSLKTGNHVVKGDVVVLEDDLNSS